MNQIKNYKKYIKYILLIAPFICVVLITVFVKKNKIDVYKNIENLSNLFGIVSAILSIIVINSVESIKKDIVEDRNNKIIEDQQKSSLKKNFDENINTLTDFISALSNIILSSNNFNMQDDLFYIEQKKLYIYNLINSNLRLLTEVSKQTKYKDIEIIEIPTNISKLNLRPPNKEIYKRLEDDLRCVNSLLILINKL